MTDRTHVTAPLAQRCANPCLIPSVADPAPPFTPRTAAPNSRHPFARDATPVHRCPVWRYTSRNSNFIVIFINWAPEVNAPGSLLAGLQLFVILKFNDAGRRARLLYHVHFRIVVSSVDVCANDARRRNCKRRNDRDDTFRQTSAKQTLRTILVKLIFPREFSTSTSFNTWIKIREVYSPLLFFTRMRRLLFERHKICNVSDNEWF